jgi:hypothetical protein
MLADFVVDKELIIFASLARDDPFVILQKFEKRVFTLLQVFEEEGPVIIEMRLKGINILKVHSNKYIIYTLCLLD